MLVLVVVNAPNLKCQW